MKPIIIIENAHKKYSRRANAHRQYGIGDLWRELIGGRPRLELRTDEFLAVNDVSFHLYPGETFALVGRNGSGKTTLLKMMNGLIKPDAGTIIMDGRVQALINLGAGFNPALSGHANVFNSAALMGFNHRQTMEILDRIVAFSELEEFIDSPLETYSAGMRARLGFAVAVHLRPEILLIDEILSVGDHAFQNKCFRKMQELKAAGVTSVLVSHNHTYVVQLCEKALWLHKGRAMRQGPAKETVQAYLDFLEEEEARSVREADEKARAETRQKQARAGTPEPRPTRVAAAGSGRPGAATAPAGKPPEKRKPREAGLYHAIYDDFDMIDQLEVRFTVGGEETVSVRTHDPVSISYSFRLRQRVEDLNVSLVFYREDGLQVAAISTLNGDLLKPVHEGVVRATVHIEDLNFNPGRYVLVMPIHEGKSYLYRNVVKRFTVRNMGRLQWALVDLRYRYEIERTV